jgi:hypothetical protein
MVTKGHELNSVSYETACQTTDDHGRDIDTCGYFDAKRDYGKRGFDDEGDEQHSQYTWYVFECWAQPVTGICVRVARARQLEQELGDWQFGITVPEADQTGYRSNEEDLKKRISLDDWDTAESTGPNARCFDEQGTQNASKSTSKDESDQLKELPVEMITDLEEYNLLCAIWIKEFKGERRCLQPCQLRSHHQRSVLTIQQKNVLNSVFDGK